MKASDKSNEVEEFLDSMLEKFFGNGSGRKASIEANKCALCGREATQFKDAVSAKEFSISGMCQKCQDIAFGSEDEE